MSFCGRRHRTLPVFFGGDSRGILFQVGSVSDDSKRVRDRRQRQKQLFTASNLLILDSGELTLASALTGQPPKLQCDMTC